MTKQIIMVDASAYKSSSCFLRLKRIILDGYRSKVNSNDIEYGLAFHKFSERLEYGNSVEESLAPALLLAQEYYKNKPMLIKKNKAFLTVEHLVGTCMDWFATRQQDNLKTVKIIGELGKLPEDKRKYYPEGTPLNQLVEIPLVECKFALPLWKDDNYEVLLSGTIDRLVEGQKDCFAIFDYKTTSSWDQESFFDGFRLDPQLGFYFVAIKKLAKMFPDSIYAKMITKRLAGFIQGIFLSSSKPPEFKRSNAFEFKDNWIVEFEAMINLQINRFIDYLQGSNFYHEGIMNGSCKTIYGECAFAQACSAPDSKTEEIILETRYKKKQYNPLKFDE